MTTPHQTVIPTLRYEDAPAAIEWLCANLGFREQFVVRDGDTVHHAQLEFRGSLIMLGSLGNHPELAAMDQIAHRGSTNLTAESTAQVDELHARAIAAGAEILQPITDTEYGSHAFTCADPEGNHWHVGTYDALAEDGSSAG